VDFTGRAGDLPHLRYFSPFGSIARRAKFLFHFPTSISAGSGKAKDAVVLWLVCGRAAEINIINGQH
jgi:hypothetical protein